MSLSFDVYINFKGTKAELVRLLDKELSIRVAGDNPWLFGFVEIVLTSRKYDPHMFEGRRCHPYKFLLQGTTYAAARDLGEITELPIMDVLAQLIAGTLNIPTMISCDADGSYRHYRAATRSQKREGWSVIDKSTGKPPEGFFV